MPALSPALQEIKRALMSGERMTCRDANAQHPDLHRSSVHLTFKRWCAAGMLHIWGYEQLSSGGKPSPIYAWGKARNATPPLPNTGTENVRLWRERNVDKYERQLALAKATRLRANPPKLDPLLAALLGDSHVVPGSSDKTQP